MFGAAHFNMPRTIEVTIFRKADSVYCVYIFKAFGFSFCNKEKYSQNRSDNKNTELKMKTTCNSSQRQPLLPLVSAHGKVSVLFVGVSVQGFEHRDSHYTFYSY